ncbi:MAG: hypothetical protein A2150_00215 [Candidatus Muproteobacteria bacterium RBG_16_64_11]|uniref:histidine kinase n=1 Tax=Candidatus Muproteobacteria bacterium RBG_16_64_11 TaxID=1817758 RepID=A0A1F6TH48_9PROT|nr:MAG: hypothetical protein A2150_00215 [Candidatus Muproteobacteria bacterium RBG_16_64_11]
MNPSSSPLSSTAINLRRLLALRYIALTGQALVLWVAVVDLHMALPQRPLVWIIAGMAVANLLSWLRLKRPWPVREAELFGQLLLDVVALTALLYFSGGPTNPFVMLYLLPLALTAAALPGRYTWVMAGVTAACYSALLVWYVPLPQSHGAHGDEFHLHVLGMWLGFVLSAGLIAWFAVKMAATVRSRDRLLAAMRERELKHERILALGTLATGAAHELGTPLATMAVLVKDIAPGQGIADEKLAILRAQIARCKEILSSLSAAAGQMRAESGRAVALDEFLRELVQRWQSMRPGVETGIRLEGVRPAPMIVAEQTLAQAITNIFNNAADVSPASVEIDGRWTEDELTLEIADRGPGLSPELASVAGKPFVTTKSEGLGLGLFLAYSTFSHFGGEVRLLNRDGGGVVCRLHLPLAALTVND